MPRCHVAYCCIQVNLYYANYCLSLLSHHLYSYKSYITDWLLNYIVLTYLIFFFIGNIWLGNVPEGKSWCLGFLRYRSGGLKGIKGGLDLFHNSSHFIEYDRKTIDLYLSCYCTSTHGVPLVACGFHILEVVFRKMLFIGACESHQSEVFEIKGFRLCEPTKNSDNHK